MHAKALQKDNFGQLNKLPNLRHKLAYHLPTNSKINWTVKQAKCTHGGQKVAPNSSLYLITHTKKEGF